MNYLFKKLTDSINSHSNVILMTHSHPDLDGMSSALCLYDVCLSLKKEAYVIVPTELVNVSLKKGLEYLKDKEYSVNYVTYPLVNDVITENSLLIILDTQKPELVQYQELLDMKDIIVIDHHINSSEHVTNTLFEYIDSNKSSTAEIMINYLKYLKFQVNRYVATLMLTGMYIDTQSFSLKTSSKTFLSASYLLECGASLDVKNELLKESKEDYLRKANYMKQSYYIKEGYLLCNMGQVDDVTSLAILADELLRLKGVEVAFTVGKIGNVVRISARSMGKISVNVIMEALGGGGHITDAACQFNDKSIDEVIDMLKNIVMEV